MEFKPERMDELTGAQFQRLVGDLLSAMEADFRVKCVDLGEGVTDGGIDIELHPLQPATTYRGLDSAGCLRVEVKSSKTPKGALADIRAHYKFHSPPTVYVLRVRMKSTKLGKLTDEFAGCAVIGGDEVAQWARRYPWIVEPYLGGVYPAPGLVPISDRVRQLGARADRLAANERRTFDAVFEAMADPSARLVVSAAPGARLDRVADAVVARLASDGDPAGGAVAWVRDLEAVAPHLPSTQKVRLIGRISCEPAPGSLEAVVSAGGVRGLVLFVDKPFSDHVRARLGSRTQRARMELPSRSERRDYARQLFSPSDADELAYSVDDLDLLDMFFEGEAEEGLRARHTPVELEAWHWEALLCPEPEEDVDARWARALQRDLAAQLGEEPPGERSIPWVARGTYVAAWILGEAFEFERWWGHLPTGGARLRALGDAVAITAQVRGRPEADDFMRKVADRAVSWVDDWVRVARVAPAALTCSTALFQRACREVMAAEVFDGRAATALLRSAKSVPGSGYHAMRLLLALGRSGKSLTSGESSLDRLAHELVGPGRDIDLVDIGLAFDALLEAEQDDVALGVLAGVSRTWLRGPDSISSSGALMIHDTSFVWIDDHPHVPPLRARAADLVIAAFDSCSERAATWDLLDPSGWDRDGASSYAADAVRRCVQHAVSVLPRVSAWSVRAAAERHLTFWLCDEQLALPPEPVLAAFDRDPSYLAFLASLHVWPAIIDPEATVRLIRDDRSGAWASLAMQRWSGPALDALVQELPADPHAVLRLASEVVAAARSGAPASDHVVIAWASARPAPFRAILLDAWETLPREVQRLLAGTVPLALADCTGPAIGVLAELDALSNDPGGSDEGWLLALLPAIAWRWGDRSAVDLAAKWVEHPSAAIRCRALEWLDPCSPDPIVGELVDRALADDLTCLSVLRGAYALLRALDEDRLPEAMTERVVQRFTEVIGRGELDFWLAPVLRAWIRRDPETWWAVVEQRRLDATCLDPAKLAEPDVLRALACAPRLSLARGAPLSRCCNVIDTLVRRLPPATLQRELAQLPDPERAATWLVAIGPRLELLDPIVDCLRALVPDHADEVASKLASNMGSGGKGRPVCVPPFGAPLQPADDVDAALRARAVLEGGRLGSLLTTIADRRRVQR